MTRLGNLEKKFPGVPPAVLLKADLLFSGIAITKDLIEAGKTAAPHFRRVEFEGARHPIPYFLFMPDGQGGETLVLVRPDATGPYRLECAPDGKFVLCEGAQQISTARPHPRNQWFDRASQMGLRRAMAGLEQHGDMLVANLSPACEYWQKPGESENFRCRFCGYGAVSERSKTLGQVMGDASFAPEVLSEFKQILPYTESETRHLYLVGGSLRNRDHEGSRYLTAIKTAVAEAGFKGVIGCGSQALGKDWIQRIHDAGASYGCFNLEVWDPDVWRKVCPGKAKFITREQWLQDMVDAVKIFGRGGVLSAFVAGTELVSGFSSEARAIESAVEGTDWLLSQGITPLFSPFSPTLTSEYSAASAPTLDYFLRLNIETLRLRKKHKLPMNTRFVCRHCTYAQLECDLDLLTA